MASLRHLTNRALQLFGVKLVPAHHDQLLYQHDYGRGGFEAYRRVQVDANRRKFNRVFADERTLSAIAKDISTHGLAREGICHGARNGWEVEWFSRVLGCTVIGTDISETANEVRNLVQHDFHEVRHEWIGSFSFVYTNSLDQAFNPKKALDTWAGQLTPDGRIYIEHTMLHSPTGSGEMDPFGAHPMAMPYLLFEWGKGKYRLADILHVEGIEHAAKERAWIFVLELESSPASTK